MQNTWEKIGYFFKKHWKLLAFTAGPVILLVIIFSLPIKVVPIDVSETYLTTEIQSQPYIAQETYQENEAYTGSETTTETVYDSYTSGYNWNYSFTPKPNATVSISINGMGYSSPPYIYWGDNTTDPLYPGRWFNLYNWNASSRIVITMTYPAVKYRLVSKTRDVIKYKDVEIPVQKERIVTKSYRMSLWAYFFMDQSKIATVSQ